MTNIFYLYIFRNVEKFFMQLDIYDSFILTIAFTYSKRNKKKIRIERSFMLSQKIFKINL